jgi:hypothetical protein
MLTLLTALCLLAGTFVVPAQAALVCRMTGQTMQPVAEEKAHGSCCGVKLTASATGQPRLALSHPGCCDLRQSAERTDLPAVTVPAPEIPVALLVSVPSAAPLPVVTEVVLEVLAPRESAPRAPPLLSSASPRAPPFFS